MSAPVYPQIPWAEVTKVTYKNGFIVLKRPNAELEVWRDGDVRISFESRKDIESHMKLDWCLTQELRSWIEFCEDDQDDCIQAWAVGKAVYVVPPGTLEWRPGSKVDSRELGMYGQGNNADNELWRGDPFDFTHYQTPDSEGLAIKWHDGADVEVWTGDVESFMGSQEEPDPDSMDDFRHYNELFENGILWAFDEMGVFDRPDIRVPESVIELVWEDPDLMWGELVEKLIPQVERNELDPKLEEAVRTWVTRRHREAERATGQKFLWPRLYPRKKKVQ